MKGEDAVRRFVLPGGTVRGQHVRLAAAWQLLREHGGYPEPVRDLLGEAAAAAVLLAATLKFDGTLTLQLQGNGAIRLLVAQCSNRFELRAVARYDAARVQPEFATLIGAGQITVTIDTQSAGGARYQGIVPTDGASLARCLEHYFDRSEQLPTALLLSADADTAAG
ncbi:MAG: Hsp33 family molecular chaperone HslO, partial [Gammaproteobacteria bacterium]|nr:Hsp33 family molecular chaperone HslO [Gammaproteobacteria bacterium]